MTRFVGFLLTMVSLIMPALSVELSDALDAPGLVWETGGDAPWFGQTEVSADGADAAQAWEFYEGSESWLQTTVTGPTTVSFWWAGMTYGEVGVALQFLVDGIERKSIPESYEIDWEQERFIIPAGAHTLRWTANAVVFEYSEAHCEGYVDQVTVGEPVISDEPLDAVVQSGQQAALQVKADGAGTLSYQWYEGTSGDVSAPLANATNSSFATPLVMADTAYWVRVSNALGEVSSRTARVRIGFEVHTLADLQKIGSGQDGWTMDAAYMLMNDIDASATATWNDEGTDESVLEGFATIGRSLTERYDPDTGEWYCDGEVFAGFFDGKGHVIRGLVVNRAGQEGVGLFGHLGDSSVVENVGLVGARVTGGQYVGGLAGQVWNARIVHCFTAGEVCGASSVGGVVGVIGDSWSSDPAARSDVYRCYSLAKVSGERWCGGLIGENYNGGCISQCYSVAPASGSDTAGGLVGYTDYTIRTPVESSYWDMTASGLGSSAGGEGKTSEEMRHQATFAGWDFETVWGMQEGEGAPYLRLFAEGQTAHEAIPSAAYPANLSFIWPLRPVLTAAVAVAGCDYVNARWQVATAADFSDARDWMGVAEDADSLRSPFSSRVPVAAALDYGMFYYWRVRLQTGYGMWSDWSAPALFLVWEPFDKLAAGKDELGVWVDGLVAGSWLPAYLLGAHEDFTAAVQQQGTNVEARIYRAVTALMSLAEDQELRGLLADFGYAFDESLLTFGGAFAGTASPPSNEAVDRLAAQTLPVIEAALADLAAIPAEWPGTVVISPDDFPVDEPVHVDIGDVLYSRATLGAARSLLETAQAYDLTLDYGKTNLFLPDPVAPVLAVTLDGDEAEWSEVPATLFGDYCQVEYAKVARSATQLYVLARLADGATAQAFQAEFGSTTASRSLWFDDLHEGAFSTDWDGLATLFCQGNVLEMAYDIPAEEQGEHFRLRSVGVRYPSPLPAAAPTLAVTQDGDASEWSEVPTAPVSGGLGRIDSAKIARSDTDIHVLMTLHEGWTFEGMGYLYVGVSTFCGGYFSFGLESGGVTYGMSPDGVLEISCPIPAGYAEASFFLDGVEVELKYNEWVWAFDSKWYVWSSWDEASRGDELQPLNQFLADHPACMQAVRNPGKLPPAKAALRDALVCAAEADAAIVARTDGLMHFVEYDPENAAEQAELRRRLQEARAAMDSPQPVTVEGHQANVFLGAFFDAPHLTRAFLPRFTDDDELVSGTFPDPTLKGILPDMTQAAWQDKLLGVVPLAVESAFAMDGQTFTTGGYALWGVTQETGGRTNVAQSGLMAKGSPTWVEATFTGPGTLSFAWAVSTTQDRNFLSVYVDGVRQTDSLSGETGWRPRQLILPAGSHKVRWAYVKNDRMGTGLDAGMLDSLSWSAGTSAATGTPVPVPYAWLEGFAGLVQGGDYDAAAFADQDHDGRTTWEEYVAGTVPTNAASLFLATITPEGPGLVVGWTPDLGPARVYTVEGKPDLTDPAWGPTNAASRFFRVKVQMP